VGACVYTFDSAIVYTPANLICQILGGLLSFRHCINAIDLSGGCQFHVMRLPGLCKKVA
jgi:hypothetical protein